MAIKLLTSVLILFIVCTCIIPAFSHKKCLVCKKNLEKKTTRKALPSAEVLLRCFGVTYSEDSPTPPVLCPTCFRNVFIYKKTGKTFSHVSIICYVVYCFTVSVSYLCTKTARKRWGFTFSHKPVSFRPL